MPTEILEIPTRPVTPGGPGAPPGRPPGGDRDRGPGGGGGGLAADPVRFGLWLFLGTVSMLFIGFTSAYLVRRAGADWVPLRPPSLVWWNTTALLASSVALEAARRRLRAWAPVDAMRWVMATGALGLLFAVGQLAAWRALAARGLYLDTNPHHSFFYVLTGVHLVHLGGGLVWFGVVLARMRALAYTPGEDGLGLFATYWHFLAGLWVYLLMLLVLL
jgi:cytochrome c oxidase subunit 3